jgi:hypothetical protein
MVPIMRLTDYEFDDSIDVLDIIFKYPTGGYTDEVDLPKGVLAACRYQIDKKGVLNRIEVINPDVFIKSSETDGVEIQGYNVKQLISELSTEK